MSKRGKKEPKGGKNDSYRPKKSYYILITTFMNAIFGMFTHFKCIMKELGKTIYLKIYAINCGRKLFHHYDIKIAISQ